MLEYKLVYFKGVHVHARTYVYTRKVSDRIHHRKLSAFRIVFKNT